MFADALFHLHTRRTDGDLDIADYFQFAREFGVARVIFLEHVRREPTYDVREFATAIRTQAAAHGVAAAVGFEAKILADGSLDIGAEALGLADVVGAAEHGRPPEEAGVFPLYRRMWQTARAQVGPRPLVWVHPGLWLKRAGLLERHRVEYLDHLQAADAAGVHVEHNLRYALWPADWLPAARLPRHCIGADAHRPEDLARWREQRGAPSPLGAPHR